MQTSLTGVEDLARLRFDRLSTNGLGWAYGEGCS